MKILDCTLRDGGYLNNWDFPITFAKNLYSSVSKAGVDIIELGFIYPKNSGGYFKTLTPENAYAIKESYDGEGSNICVMVDYGKCKFDLPPKKSTCIDLVRVAAHKKDIYEAANLCLEIQIKGYIASLQMMNFPSYSFDEMIQVFKYADNIDLKYVYIGDSFGSMYPCNVLQSLEIMNEYNFNKGFHPHNNLQLAFANSIIAIEKDIDIIDGTVLGIGRGAGNLPLEIVVAYLSKLNKKYNPIPLFDFIEDNSMPFINCGYEPSCEYKISGLLNIHPNKASKYREKGMRYSDMWNRYWIKK